MNAMPQLNEAEHKFVESRGRRWTGAFRADSGR